MLSERLKSVAKFASYGKIVADIGCDHGLLGIELLKNNMVDKVYAIDNKQNALNGAVDNIKKHKLENKVFPILGDGIEKLPSDVDTIVIAGLGALNILKMLKTKPLLNQIDYLIVQSNNNLPLLRKEIPKLGYYIKGEKVILENNKYYITIMFAKGYKRYGYVDKMFGPILKKRKIAVNYYIYLKEDYLHLLNLLPKKSFIKTLKIKYLIMNLNQIIKSLS